MQAGFTFVLSADQQHIDSHLWVILSDPARDADHVLIVSLTTLDDRKESVCIIERGEHPWVTHRTCVAYEHARSLSLAALYALKDTGKIQMREPMPEQILARIRWAAGDSTRLKMKFADLLIDQGLLDC